MEGTFSPSDLFTKILGWAKFWPLIQPLLFWKGETVKPLFLKSLSLRSSRRSRIRSRRKKKRFPLLHYRECKAVLISHRIWYYRRNYLEQYSRLGRYLNYYTKHLGNQVA
jgi:hypothetical protein